jgi:hypothetical protein
MWNCRSLVTFLARNVVLNNNLPNSQIFTIYSLTIEPRTSNFPAREDCRTVCAEYIALPWFREREIDVYVCVEVSAALGCKIFVGSGKSMSSVLATGSKQQRDARTCTSTSVSRDY